MASLMEPPSPPSASRPLPLPTPEQTASTPSSPPIKTYQLRRLIPGGLTDLVIQTFDDRILVIVTQNEKVGILTQATIPQVAQLPHPPSSSSNDAGTAPEDGSSGMPVLPPPPASLTLTPLLGSPRPDDQALYDLYISQIATLVWWTLQETHAPRRPVVVGLSLSGRKADGDDVSQRDRFADILKMVIEWPGPM